MAVALPNFAEFDVHLEGAVDTRWKKWLARFRNLLLALDVDNAKRQRALLLHYAGESVNEIFETLPDTDAGEDEDPFEKAVTALTNYFTPKKNREYEVYVFRKAKQESDESISAFHTRLRRLAMTCEFANTDREIKTQIVQNCLLHKLRMKALQNPDLTLTQLLDAGKAMDIHIREEKLPALLMENYVAGVGSKTTLKLYVDPKIPIRETSPRIRNVTFKT